MINWVQQGTATGDIPAWAHRRRSFDPYVRVLFDVARTMWKKLRQKHKTYFVQRDAHSIRHLDDRTLRDIGISRADAYRMAYGPTSPTATPPSSHGVRNFDLGFRSSVFSNQAG